MRLQCTEKEVINLISMNTTNQPNNRPSVGIDDMSLYVPKIYFDIKDLAEARAIEYAKLNKGLGLSKMAMLDAHEDAATMAANAVADLIEKNQLDPSKIGRIYLGTESALDGAKPTATYVLEMLRGKYASTFGGNCFLNCDVVDLTFACVGGVDALHNTIDWVRGGTERIGIVVSTDNAKYELASSGEYTQGAGAIAILVKEQPRLLAFGEHWGIATMGVHDFYKPKIKASKAQVIKEVLELAAVHNENGTVDNLLAKLTDSLEVNGVLDINDRKLTLHKDTPTFDGPFSNQCYQDRIGEAYQHIMRQKVAANEFDTSDGSILYDNWAQLIFHLPYAFHGKRIFSDIFIKEIKRTGKWEVFKQENGLEEPSEGDFDNGKDFKKATALFLKSITKTPAYKNLVSQKIEKGQRASSEIGNMYTCSVFLALMSVLQTELNEKIDLGGQKLGFFAYGSGSKSKVFEATVQPEWQSIVAKFELFNNLEKRTAIDYSTYEQLHTGERAESVLSPTNEFSLKEIGTEGVTKGARYYEWK